jgi:3-phenylpropionate/trans-cinnamate dioxygenase ferredoxin component
MDNPQPESTEYDFIAIAPLAELPNGERIFAQVDEYPIVLFNIAGGIFAIGDVCTHDNGPLGEGEVDGFEVRCPRHGASFDVRDGRVQALPAVEDIPAYPVRVRDGQIEVGIPHSA